MKSSTTAPKLSRVSMKSNIRIREDKLEKLAELAEAVEGRPAVSIASRILEVAADCPPEKFNRMIAMMEEFGHGGKVRISA